jgi:hypothetical protein
MRSESLELDLERAGINDDRKVLLFSFLLMY